jgi:hypothetical protein
MFRAANIVDLHFFYGQLISSNLYFYCLRYRNSRVSLNYFVFLPHWKRHLDLYSFSEQI